jgi:hypothetical protein
MDFEVKVQQFLPERFVIGGLRWPHCPRMEISAIQMQRDGDGGQRDDPYRGSQNELFEHHGKAKDQRFKVFQRKVEFGKFL